MFVELYKIWSIQFINFLGPQAGPAIPFPFDEKEAIPGSQDVKTKCLLCVDFFLKLVANLQHGVVQKRWVVAQIGFPEADNNHILFRININELPV